MSEFTKIMSGDISRSRPPVTVSRLRRWQTSELYKCGHIRSRSHLSHRLAFCRGHLPRCWLWAGHWRCRGSWRWPPSPCPRGWGTPSGPPSAACPAPRPRSRALSAGSRGIRSLFCCYQIARCIWRAGEPVCPPPSSSRPGWWRGKTGRPGPGPRSWSRGWTSWPASCLSTLRGSHWKCLRCQYYISSLRLTCWHSHSASAVCHYFKTFLQSHVLISSLTIIVREY